MEYQEFEKTRVIFDLVDMPTGWYTEDVIICLPRFAWMLARTLTKGYGLRYANYAAEYATGGYYEPTPETYDKIDGSIAKFLEADDMTCNLEQALLAIASAITAAAACETTCGGTGSYGAGTIAPPASSFVDDYSTTYPAGFDDRAEYDVAKCSAANAIIAGIREDCVWLKTADLVTLTATFLVATFLTPIPLDDILVFVGFLVSIFLQALLVATAQAVIDLIDAEPEALVCLLVDSATASDALANLTAFFDDELTSIAATMANYFVTTEAINSLFSKSTTMQESGRTMSVDCAVDCGCQEWTLGTCGVLDSQTESQVVYSSTFCHEGINPDSNWMSIESPLGCDIEIDSLISSGWTVNSVPTLASNNYTLKGETEQIHNDEFPDTWFPGLQFGAGIFGYLISDTPFTVTIEFHRI